MLLALAKQDDGGRKKIIERKPKTRLYGLKACNQNQSKLNKMFEMVLMLILLHSNVNS